MKHDIIDSSTGNIVACVSDKLTSEEYRDLDAKIRILFDEVNKLYDFLHEVTGLMAGEKP